MESRTHQVRTRDGRVLAGRSYGPDNGQALLFIAGAASGKSMRFGTRLLRERRVRMLCMDRPGMGGSDPHPERTVQSTADDYYTFVRGVLDVPSPRIPIVANSQGAVFALAAAQSAWVARLVLVSPADDIGDPTVRELLPQAGRAFAETIANDPAAGEDILRSFGPEQMERFVLSAASQSDQRVYRQGWFQEMYRASLREGFARQGDAYVCDTFLASRKWPLDLRSVQCRVDVMMGAEDNAHSPDQGLALSERLPQARRQLVPGIGGALLWDRPELVLDAAAL